MTSAELPVLTSLRRLTELVERVDPVFVRWSRGPQTDLRRHSGVSRDSLTGVPLAGLSANPLRVEAWWGDRPTLLWVARRLYDYSHLREAEGSRVRPWVLTGEETGRGPDNEPLVRRVRPVAWIAPEVIAEARAEVSRQRGAWGPLRRPHDFADGSAKPAPGDAPGAARGGA
ncbi:hypothetical protein KBZ10_21140 [Streptomyces sp. F63]|uniref:DUF6098 family protein n=1 Tax=Streptomyces sp. F63 TaxID=2824887 RepID=UPI001B36324E|nr:DUF6098 family protein [Streptomyces sp. F63]MBQ0986972.1 hypothetical protein [Streptomyces sp. F63]